MGDAWTSATPLRNSDFKALLATPRPAHSQKTPKQHYKKQHSSEDGEQKQKFKKAAPKGRPGKPSKEGDTEKEQEGPLYRDRAKERREGVSIDFADPQQELAQQGLGPGALQALSIEQSKFLGGDIAHTHLVKGLDYALLHQERQKLEVDKSKASADAAAAAVTAAMMPRPISRESVQFQGPQGRAVFDALFRPPPVNRGLVREMFQPRRTAFVFEFGEGAGDVPTTLRRSKADCPPVQDLVSAAADGGVLERISKIMTYIQASGAGKAGKRSARDSQYIRSILAGVNPAAPGEGQVHGQLVMKGQAAMAAAAAKPGAPGGGEASGAAAAAAGDDEGDIFGEAGTDYVPAIPQKKAAPGEADTRRPDGGYFDARDHVADLQQPAAAAPGGDVGDVDMDIEEGELPGSRTRAAAAAVGYPAPPQQQDGSRYEGYAGTVQDAADDEQAQYYGQQQYQQQGWQQQGYGQQQAGYSQYEQYGQAAVAPAQPVPKWRSTAKPGGSELQGFADEAYAECFPSMMDMGVAEDEEELGKPDKPGAAGPDSQAAAAAGGRGAGRGGGRGGRGGRGGAAAGGMDDMEKKLNQKLNSEVQQMQGIFKDKGWGSEAAFNKKKHDKLDAVAATPARKRIRL